MKRSKIPLQDIVQLWTYFFGPNAPTIAKELAQRVEVGVAGTSRKVFLRHDNPSYPGRELTDQLLEIGRFFTGSAVRFSQMFNDNLIDLTFDTDGGRQLYIVPFRTESNDERIIDTVVVIYGKDLALMAFEFERLSEIGWDKLGPNLVHE